MNLAALLAWFNPTRWLILGGAVAALAPVNRGYGAWQHHLGYVERTTTNRRSAK